MCVKSASCVLPKIAAIFFFQGIAIMATTKKTTAKRAATKKTTAKKAVTKKAAAPKAAAPKAAAKKAAAPKAKSTTRPTISVQEKQQMVAAHAYYKWEQAGKPGGADFQHWIEAEAEVDAMLK
jgi:hypothetical protein